MASMGNRIEKIVVWLEPELKREAERVAQAEGRSLSNLLRRALIRLASEHPAEPPVSRLQRITDATRKISRRG
jgi:hypothetical protein